MRLPALLLIIALGCHEVTAPRAALLVTPADSVVRDGWHVTLNVGRHAECWLPAGDSLPTSAMALAECRRKQIQILPPPPR